MRHAPPVGIPQHGPGVVEHEFGRLRRPVPEHERQAHAAGAGESARLPSVSVTPGWLALPIVEPGVSLATPAIGVPPGSGGNPAVPDAAGGGAGTRPAGEGATPGATTRHCQPHTAAVTSTTMGRTHLTVRPANERPAAGVPPDGGGAGG